MDKRRKRITQACDVCNKKCDGMKPCGNCAASQYVCEYARASKKRGPKAGYIEELENRVRELEGMLSTPSIQTPSNYESPAFDPTIIALFFDNVHCRIPILDKEDFMENINQQPLFLINAMCCLALGPKNQYIAATKALVDQSLELLSTKSIIALLFLSLQISYEGNITESWVYFGMAIRMAQQMYLYSKAKLLGLSLKDQELRKRLWWALYEHDRYCCIMTSLPFAIQERDISIGYPQSGDIPYEFSLVGYRMELLKLTTRVIQKGLMSKKEINMYLDSWYSNIPQRYRIMSPHTAYVLLLYYFTRLLLNSQDSFDYYYCLDSINRSNELIQYLYDQNHLLRVPFFIHQIIIRCAKIAKLMTDVVVACLLTASESSKAFSTKNFNQAVAPSPSQTSVFGTTIISTLTTTVRTEMGTTATSWNPPPTSVPVRTASSASDGGQALVSTSQEPLPMPVETTSAVIITPIASTLNFQNFAPASSTELINSTGISSPNDSAVEPSITPFGITVICLIGLAILFSVGFFIWRRNNTPAPDHLGLELVQKPKRDQSDLFVENLERSSSIPDTSLDRSLLYPTRDVTRASYVPSIISAAPSHLSQYGKQNQFSPGSSVVSLDHIPQTFPQINIRHSMPPLDDIKRSKSVAEKKLLHNIDISRTKSLRMEADVKSANALQDIQQVPLIITPSVVNAIEEISRIHREAKDVEIESNEAHCVVESQEGNDDRSHAGSLVLPTPIMKTVVLDEEKNARNLDFRTAPIMEQEEEDSTHESYTTARQSDYMNIVKEYAPFEKGYSKSLKSYSSSERLEYRFSDIYSDISFSDLHSDQKFEKQASKEFAGRANTRSNIPQFDIHDSLERTRYD